MDHHHLTGEATAGALPGLEPLVKRAVVEALKQHTASMTAAAVAHGLADHDLASIAERAVEQELLELAEPPRPYYSTLPEWVEQWLLPLYRRSLHGHHRVWCPQWWRHDEAVARLDALWRAWEHLRLDPATGLSAWFRDHADHHMTILLDADGPLKGCDGTHSQRPLDPLHHEAPPPGTFEPDDKFIPTAPIDAPGVAHSHSPTVSRDPKIGTSPMSNRRALDHTAQPSGIELPGPQDPSSSPTGDRRVACAQCHRPADGRFKVASLPSPRPKLGSAPGHRPAFRATSTTGSPQGGNQR